MFCGFSFVKLSRKHHCNAPKLHYLCNKSEDKPHLGIKNEQVLLFCSLFALSLHQIVVIMTIKEFFPLLREKKSPQLIQIWEDYLKHLAFAMKNLNLVIDAPIIISGYLAPYFTEDDTDYLLRQINSMTPFELKEEQILVGTHGQYTPAIGAALFYVKEFIQSV